MKKSSSYAFKQGAGEQLELLVSSPTHRFGGSWTEKKLDVLSRYLSAYVTALKKQPFGKIYVDAFAGSGEVELGAQGGRRSESQIEFESFFDSESKSFIEGSARCALNVEPPFSKYVFVEQKTSFVRDLKKLKQEFPAREQNIVVIKGEANETLLNLCSRVIWKKNRAVIFLDPYGMQVRWKTLEAIAETKAVDLWYLFPLGVAVSRLLRNDGEIPEDNQKKLDEIFGTKLWRNVFYRKQPQMGLFDRETPLEKHADLDVIEQFFLSRLRTIFPHVAKRPGRMLNAKGNPLYSLCFAASNPRGGKIALDIANHLLKL